jgi:hypothetical protein
MTDARSVSRLICGGRAGVRTNVRCMAPPSVTAAEENLRRWAEANARRDEIIREAAAAGVSIRQIQQITGIARITIMHILARAPRPKRPVLRLVTSDEPPPRPAGGGR